ncbi:MAG: hypothetical protein P8Y24_13765 [Gammaproteobacteria bacterium]
MAESSDYNMVFTAEVLGGEQDDTEVTSFYGTVTTPSRYPVSFHLEAVSDDTEDASLQGAGGHLYYRDPRWGMLGVTAARTSIDLAETEFLPAVNNLEVNMYGVEAELEVEQLLFAIQAGRIESDDFDFIEDDYLNIELHWGVNQQWYLIAGSYQFSDETTNFAEANYSFYKHDYVVSPYLGSTWDSFESNYLGLEIRHTTKSLANWTFFMEVDNGEGDYKAYFFGVRYEFGHVDAVPVVSLFQRNVGGYSFISSETLY